MSATSAPSRPGPALEVGADERRSSPRARLLLSVGLLLALALAVRVAYVLHTHDYIVSHDAISYDYLARTLAKGHGWGYGNSAYRPPGYPIFLAGVYDLVGIPHGVFTAARLVQALLATATIALIGVMAWQLAGRRAMLATLAIGALYLPLVMIGVALMSESLFVPLVLTGIVCALQSRAGGRRYPWIVLAGFFVGLASLTRGNGIVVALGLAVLVWTGKPRWSWRSLAAPLTLLALTAVTISPWTIRNAYAQHAFIPVTDELGNTLKGTYNPYSAKQRFIWWGTGYTTYDSIQHDKRLTESQRNSKLISAVIQYIGRHPEYLPEAMFWNTLRLLDLQGRRVSQMTAHDDTYSTKGVADAGVVCFWIVGALAIVGIFTAAARRIPRSFWAIPFLLWLSIAPVTTGTPRFRAVLDPFFILLAAFGIQALSRRSVVDAYRRSRARRARTRTASRPARAPARPPASSAR